MSPPLTRLERDACLGLDQALANEWLETDGLGGYASSTIHFCPTRRYHGLLVSRPEGSSKRHLFLSRFEETVRNAEGGECSLSMARYADTYAPLGYQAIQRFELAPYPTSTYRFGEAEVVREVLMVRGASVVLCRYSVRGAGELELDLRPLLPFREADALTTENPQLDPSSRKLPSGMACRPYAGLPELHLSVDAARHEWTAKPTWYKGIELPEEQRRGYDHREDQFCPGQLTLGLSEGGDAIVAVSLGEPVGDPRALWQVESEVRREATAGLDQSDYLARCALAADDFLYTVPALLGTEVDDGEQELGERLAVCAGYPWFGEWGRDAFIALPGLTLSRGRIEQCGDALSTATEFLSNGLLPNIYGLSRADSHYGSADAALWFARAVRLYHKAAGAKGRERVHDELLPALVEIGEAYMQGTGLGIHSDEGGLIVAGTPDLNPTWMDAQTAAGPVTPRDGCPVEINALWYALLAHLEDLFAARGERAPKRLWMERRRLAKRTFLERFWLPDDEYLADVWKNGAVDANVRPNMVIAAALERSPLTRAQRAGVVARAGRDLLTPKGLRTLPPGHVNYQGVYGGTPAQRDAAYHQGTVWPWLLGFFTEASLRARGTKKAVRDELRALWSGLVLELDNAGLGHLSEVFDGDAPHRAGGTIAQAWNTAELLRAHVMLDQNRL